MGVTVQSLTRPVMAATHLVYTLTLLVLLLVLPTNSSPYGKRAADALAVGDAEPISAMNGFYGNPLYRPYGFVQQYLILLKLKTRLLGRLSSNMIQQHQQQQMLNKSHKLLGFEQQLHVENHKMLAK